MAKQKKIDPPQVPEQIARAADRVIEAAELVKAGRGTPMQVLAFTNSLVWTAESVERDTRADK